MEKLTIDASPTQLRSLRKGRRVRIKKGTGCNLIVHPATYHLVSRAFNKGKGAQVQLSGEEIDANREHSQHPEMEGKGIFGNAFDNILKKTGLNRITDPLGQVAKPFVKTAIAGLMNRIPIVGPRLGQLAGDYIDDPQKYQSKQGALTALKEVGLGTAKDKLGLGVYAGRGMGLGCGVGDEPVHDVKVWGKGLHTYGNRIKAGYAGAEARDHSAHLAHEHIMAREARKAGTMHDSDPDAPRSRGYGLMGHGMHHSQGAHSIVGRGGGMVEYCPPAMVSQPFSANWQMGHFLPVQYQLFNQSMHAPHGYSMHGQGLY
jgi:hypothetical protein